ncbi:MAG: adenosine deaminase [Candidatus Latescibacteria bacterium]|nr:adenosine deaminase [Candidatus Latescibacterota bacterium]
MRRSPPRRRTSPWGDARRRRALLLALPKTDLHVHLDGSIRPSTLFALAREQGVALPVRGEAELKRFLDRLTAGVSLPTYLKAFDLTLSTLQQAPALERAAFELAEDAHRENVRYMEVRYCPALHTKRGLTLSDTVDAVARGLDAAGRRYGIQTGTIVCGIRHLSPKLSLELADLAVAYMGRGVVGFDLAGAEKDYPAKAHREAFDRVLRNNVNVTVHAGEAFGPGSIRQALHYCGAHRIGHGTRLREDPMTLDYVNDHRIPLEMCLTSNVQTRAVSGLREHPFREYLKLGVRVTLNTDNRLVSSTTMTDELDRAVQTFAMGPGDVRQVLMNGFKSAFVPFRSKGGLLRRAIAEMDAVLRGAKIPKAESERDLL